MARRKRCFRDALPFPGATLLFLLLRKGFKYRVYPSDEQIARLSEWESALRFLWNLAHEQRLLGLARTDKRYPAAFDQHLELTALRAELPWLADVPRNVCAQLLVDLDAAWQRCFKKLARRPRWKRKGKDFLAVTEPHREKWRLDGSTLHFPKLGPVRVVLHRPLEGTPKRCTIRRDGDQWFASILCEIEVSDPAPHPGPPVGLDRGIVALVADSNGVITPNPKHLAASAARLARAQREVSRRKKGSKNREKSKARVARLHRKVRRQRDHVLHCLSSAYAKSHGLVVVEDLRIKNMVRANTGLARSIHDAAWGRFDVMLGYKTIWNGGERRAVVAAWSSCTCAACGHIDPASRVSQARFVCTGCGVVEHADVNAAKVILQRGLIAVEPTVTVCGGTSAVRLPTKQKLRVARRGTQVEGLVHSESQKAPAFTG